MSEPKEAQPCLVVFGLDEQRKPRAGAFVAAQAEEARKRAVEARLVVAAVEGDKLVEAARPLSAGDLSKPGAAFVPVVQRQAYERVLTASGITGEATAPPVVADAAGASAGPSGRIPATRETISVGDMVLVADPEPGDGWFEAIVLEEVGTDTFKLRYRDYLEHPDIVRRREDFALLPPGK